MNSLSPSHVFLDCNAKTVSLAMNGVSRVECNGASGSIIDRLSNLSVLRDWLRKVICLTWLLV